MVDGINALNDSTVLLQLHAPDKDYVYVLGDFNGYLPDSAYYMHKSVNGEKFWLVLDLQAGQTYTYNCSPNCKAVLSIGDQADHFATLIDQQLQSQILTEGE